MDRSKRLRRVLLLVAAFARNLAYLRAMQPVKGRIPKASPWDFWMTLSNNALDAVVLEWCKLFADPNDKHHWSKIVSKPDDFRSELLKHLEVTKGDFDAYQTAMRRYRDKFVAHLDSDEVMDIPDFDLAERSVAFYHSHLVSKEVADAAMVFKGLPPSPAALATYYKDELRTATIIYDKALPPDANQ
jgi:hypothetical protein